MTAQLHLPDVSEFQRNVDWPKVVAHNGGAAIMRVYNGRRPDRLWPARRAAAHAAGIKVLGLYCYLVKDVAPLTQAREFVKLVGKLHPGEFPILDIEEGTAMVHERAQTFLTYVDNHLCHHEGGTWLYSYAAFMQAHNLASLGQPKRHVWVASYGSVPPTMKHTLWQHRDNEVWPGIGKCDCSIFNGTLHQLEALVEPKVQVITAPKPTTTTPTPTTTPAKPRRRRRPKPVSLPMQHAKQVHDISVAAGVFLSAFLVSLIDSVSTGKAATVAVIAAAASAGAKALARKGFPGVVDLPKS